VKFIKFILCLSIFLFVSSAAAEIYKYLDENGNIHFTDDFTKVPAEQRTTVDVSVEYVNDTNPEPIAESQSSDETNEAFSAESAEKADKLTDGSENQDEMYNSVDTSEEEKIAALGQHTDNEEDLTDPSNKDKTENDPDEIRNQLDAMKKEIDGEYQALVKEKEKLTQEKKSIKGHDEILKHNKEVEHLNEKVEAYANKGKAYEARVEAYNEWVRQENAKTKKNLETP